jgi:hypothetical protein
LRVWRDACERANDWEKTASNRIARETKDNKKRIRELELELARKEKALAETAALIVLRKKPRRSGALRRARPNDLCS